MDNKYMKISDLGTIMGVWAHPDDEAFTSAGLMFQAVTKGQRVACVTATRGEEGVRDLSRWPKAKLREIRTKELSDSLAVIDVNEHYWLEGVVDGKCAEADQKSILQQLVKIGQAVKPDTIISFGLDGLTGHPDHQAACNWALSLAKSLSFKPRVLQFGLDKQTHQLAGKMIDKKFNLYFNLVEPILLSESEQDLRIVLEGEALAKKIECLKTHASQMTQWFEQLDQKLIEEFFKIESFKLVK